MKKIFSCLALLMLLIVSMAGVAFAEDSARERGRYIYDDAGRLKLDSTLLLSAYLWKTDVDTGYETVIVFPKDNMNVSEMGDWFDAHGVGKLGKDNGLAIFIFPDNAVYGILGKGHDRIATPFLTTPAAEALDGIDTDPTLAILNLLTVMGEYLDKPTTFETATNAGSWIYENLDLVGYWLAFLLFVLILVQQWDGFQLEDVKISGLIVVVAAVLILVVGAFSLSSSETVREYGIISHNNFGQYSFVETHSTTDAKGNTRYWTDSHTMYTNNVTIFSYDGATYYHVYETKDYKGSWNNHPIGNYLQLGINARSRSLSWVGEFTDFSGGKTNRGGCPIDWKTASAKKNKEI